MKMNKLLVLAASSLLSMGLASCGGATPSSSTSSTPVETSSSAEEKSSDASASGTSEGTSEASSEASSEVSSEALTPKQVSLAKDLDYFLVGSEVDLEEYIVVKMSDGSLVSDYDYTLTCSDDTLMINGHLVSSDVAKSYSITVTAGSARRKVTLDFRTQENLDLIEFLDQAKANPKNYQVDSYDFNDQGELVYQDSVIHTENYCAWADLNDLGNDHDDTTNSIAAKLSDGAWYWGAFDATGTPVFEAGKFSPVNYYFYGDFAISGADFTTVYETDDETGETYEYLSADPTVTESFYGAAIGFSLNSNYSYGNIKLMGFGLDDEDNIESATFYLSVLDKKGTSYALGIFTIHSFGEAKLDELEPVATDASYLPQVIVADEIPAVFAAAETLGNYSVTFDMVALDPNGEPLTFDSEGLDTNIMNLVFGVVGIHSELVVTENDIVSTLTTTSVGQEAFEDTEEIVAYKAEEGVVTKYAFDEETKEYKETVVEDATTIADTNLYKNFNIGTVPVEKVSDIEFSKKETDPETGIIKMVSSSVGDSDGTTSTNDFFIGLVNYNMAFNLAKWFAPMDGWGDGNNHSLSQCTRGFNIEIDTDPETASFTAAVKLYSPFSNADGYIYFQFSLNKIGTSESAYPTVVENIPE